MASSRIGEAMGHLSEDLIFPAGKAVFHVRSTVAGISSTRRSCLGGIHLEKAWYLGPQIGVYSGEWTLKLHRFCQAQGLDPLLTGSLLGRIMDGAETGTLSEEDLRHMDGI